MEIRIKGTLSELEQLFKWDDLYIILKIDYYMKYLVPDDEIFVLTEQDFKHWKPEINGVKTYFN